MPNPYFQFKKFTIYHDQCAMKVGTDGVLLGSWADVKGNPKTIVDIGAGTGLITLMAAQRFNNASVAAVEIEKKCTQQCQENITSSPYGERITVYNKSIQEFTEDSLQKFDLLVSNPPFFIDALTTNNQQRNIARHNATLNQNDLWQTVTTLSHERSVFALILPVMEGELFIEKMKDYPWFLSKKCSVKGMQESKVKRVLLEFSRAETQLEISQLIVEKQRGIYTDEFTALVKDFYLHL